MKVYNNDAVDSLYLRFGDEMPEGVIEISEGVNKSEFKPVYDIAGECNI